jgi:hypothetical protein
MAQTTEFLLGHRVTLWSKYATFYRAYIDSDWVGAVGTPKADGTWTFRDATQVGVEGLKLAPRATFRTRRQAMQYMAEHADSLIQTAREARA